MRPSIKEIINRHGYHDRDEDPPVSIPVTQAGANTFDDDDDGALSTDPKKERWRYGDGTDRDALFRGRTPGTRMEFREEFRRFTRNRREEEGLMCWSMSTQTKNF